MVEGTVTRWSFRSPHVLLHLKSAADGSLYVFEGAAPPSLLGREPAVTINSLAEGAHVFVVYCPLRDGRNGGAVGLVLTDDGLVYNPADAGCLGPRRRVPHWPDWIAAGYRSLADVPARPAD